MTLAQRPNATDLFTAHSGHLRALLRGGGLRGADLDDAVQDTFARAVSCLDQLQDPDRAGVWLRTIARRVCADHHRRAQREACAATERAAAAADGWVEASAATHQPPRAPDHALCARELGDAVHAAVAQLPPSQREAVQAFYLEERSYADIERARGLSRSALAVRLHKGRKRLAALLQDALPSMPAAASSAALPALPVWAALTLLSPVLLATAPVLVGRLLTSPKRRDQRAGLTVACIAVAALGCALTAQAAAPMADPTPARWLACVAYLLAGSTGAAALAHGLGAPLLGAPGRLRAGARVAALGLVALAALNTALFYAQLTGSAADAVVLALVPVVGLGSLVGQGCGALRRGPRLRGAAVAAAAAGLLAAGLTLAGAHQTGLGAWWATVAGCVALFEVACAQLAAPRALRAAP